MVTNQKPTGRAVSMPAGLACGGAVSLGITLVSAFVLAKLLDAQTIPWEKVGYGIMVLLLLSSMGGSAISCAKIKRQRLLVCMLSGLVYLGILLSITALFFGGQYEAVGVTALLILGGCGTVGLMGLSGRRGKKRGRPASRHR